MFLLLTAVHVIVGLVLILFVLLQSARGTDVAGAFGGMGSQTAFGSPRGTATFLSKATVVLAVIFMGGAMALAILANRQAGVGASVLSGEPTAPAGQAPKPGAPPAAPNAVPVPINGAPPGTTVTVSPPTSGPVPAPAGKPAAAPGNQPAAAPSNALPAQKATGGPTSQPTAPAAPAPAKTNP